MVLATVAEISRELSEQKVWKWGGTAAGAEGGAQEAPQVPEGQECRRGPARAWSHQCLAVEEQKVEEVTGELRERTLAGESLC